MWSHKFLTDPQLDRERYPIRPKMTLFEFDERFAVFKDEFVFYDFKQPFKLPSMLFYETRIMTTSLTLDCR